MPRRRPLAAPPITVEVTPAAEMLMSVVIALDGADDDTYEVGPAWIAEIRDRAGADLMARAEAVSLGDSDTFIHLVGLVHESPAPRDPAALLAHLRGVGADEVRLHLVQYYSRDTRRMTPPSVIRAAIGGDAEARDEFLRTSHPEWEPWTHYLSRVLDLDATAYKADLVAFLSDWNERVWTREWITIQPILQRDVEAKHDLIRQLPMERFIETATNGVEFVPRPGIERVVLLPSFVNRPLVSFHEYGDALLIIYPVADETVSALTDSPPLRLVRLSKALADEKRLRILRALADGEKTLMELAEQFEVAKTTMHHHMIVLRSAGLVTTGVATKRYRLRHETLPDLGVLLGGYLGSAGGASPAAGQPREAGTTRAGRAAG